MLIFVFLSQLSTLLLDGLIYTVHAHNLYYLIAYACESGDGIVGLGNANPREKEAPETRIHAGTAETNSASSPTT